MNDKLFVVHFAIEMGLKALAKHFAGSWIAGLIGGPLGFVIGYFAEKYLNFMVTQGILAIDLTAQSWKVAFEASEYREAALKAYQKATARVYTEEEKVAIRQQYLKILRDFAAVGDGMRDGEPST